MKLITPTINSYKTPLSGGEKSLARQRYHDDQISQQHFVMCAIIGKKINTGKLMVTLNSNTHHVFKKKKKKFLTTRKFSLSINNTTNQGHL